MARFINLVGERLLFVDTQEGLISIRQPAVYDGLARRICYQC